VECRDFEKLISGFLDDELTKEQKKQCEEHLLKCVGCSRILDEFTQVNSMLRDSADPLPDEAYWSGFQARLDEKIQTAMTKKIPWWTKLFQVTRPLGWVTLLMFIVIGIMTPAIRNRVLIGSSEKVEERSSVVTYREEPVYESTTEKNGLSFEEDRADDTPEATPDVISETVGSVQEKTVEKPVKETTEKTEKLQVDLNVQPVPPVVPSVERTREKTDAATIPPVVRTPETPRVTQKTVGTTEKPALRTVPQPESEISGAPAVVAEPPSPVDRVGEIPGASEIKDEAGSDVLMATQKDTGEPSFRMSTPKRDSRSVTMEKSLLGDLPEEAPKESKDQAEIKIHLEKSEMLLIRIINLPICEEELCKLQDTVKSSDFIKHLEAKREMFAYHPDLSAHVREMHTVTTKLMHVQPGKIEELKEHITNTNLLERTRRLNR
jgi:hypothetical protein